MHPRVGLKIRQDIPALINCRILVGSGIPSYHAAIRAITLLHGGRHRFSHENNCRTFILEFVREIELIPKFITMVIEVSG